MDQRVSETVYKTGQHPGLGIRIPSFMVVVLVGKDKLLESACSTFLRDLVGKEGDITLVETRVC